MSLSAFKVFKTSGERLGITNYPNTHTTDGVLLIDLTEEELKEYKKVNKIDSLEL